MLLFGITVANTACDDWTDMEPKFQEDMTQSSLPEEYYAQLRAYKKTDHPVAFGWFGNWTGNGATLEKCLAGLPDSVDFVSIWGNWRHLTEAQTKDLRYVQNVKGTKALMCFIVQNPEEYKDNYLDFWGWNENKEEAIKKYAHAICDSIDKYGYDGFDIDYEPNFGHRGNMSGSDENMLLFIQTLGERIGPKSGTDRLLVIDGEPQSIVSESGAYFNYFIVQAYDSPGDNTGRDNLDSRLNSTIRNFDGHLTAEEVAKKYEILGTKAEDLVPVLKSMKATSDEAYNNFIASMDNNLAVIQKSGLFEEIGKSGGAHTGNDDTEGVAKMNAKVAEIKKSMPNLTDAQAQDIVMQNDPELRAMFDK